jgi:ribulose-phosphate 3-epimerase
LNNSCELYASIISDNPRSIFENIKIYESKKISGIHFDVMDGDFVPRFGLYPELLKEIRNVSRLPIEVHFMTKNFEKYLKVFIESGASRIIFHCEATKSISKSIKAISSLGIEVGVAINPETNLDFIDSIANEVDYFMLMAITPGIPKHPFIESTYIKITELRRILSLSSSKSKIGIDGGVTFDNAHRIHKAGADVLICGSGTFFHPQESLDENINLLQKKLI